MIKTSNKEKGNWILITENPEKYGFSVAPILVYLDESYILFFNKNEQGNIECNVDTYNLGDATIPNETSYKEIENLPITKEFFNSKMLKLVHGQELPKSVPIELFKELFNLPPMT